MSQGLIGGVLWGVLAAGLGLVVVSQVAPPPRGGAQTEMAAAPQAAASPVAPVAKAAPPKPPAPSAGKTVAVPEIAASPPKAPPPSEPVREVVGAPATGTNVPDPSAAPVQAPPRVALAKPEAVRPEGPESGDAAAALPRVVTRRGGDEAPDAPQVAAIATPDGPPDVATAPPAEAPELAAEKAAPGARFVSPPPKVAALPAQPESVARSEPPRPATQAPAAVADLTPWSDRPTLPTTSAAPARVARPAAVAEAAAAPVAPLRSTPGSAATVVVTAAPPHPAPPPGADRVTPPAIVAVSRSGFQPTLIAPGTVPVPDAAPATGALPPPPPLTAEELAILAKDGNGDTALPAPDLASPDLPEVIVLTEADEPAAPKVLKKPAPLPTTPSLAAKGQIAPAGQLPRIGGGIAAVPDAPADLEKTAPPPAPDALPDDAPPIDRFARPFDNPAGKPLFAVVLIDTGEPGLDRAALAAMPFAVTFALDPSVPEAALAASIYRAAGQEVAMLATGLPEGATAADVEVSFGVNEAALPEAVAVLDPETGGFQADRPLSTLVVPVVKGQGRGLLSWDRGLNAADQVARREGLRSGVIFRRLDGEGEPKAQIRRYLDRAAFKAAQDGRVIVAGETRPDTVAALLEWAVEGRAATVALAPLSAALRVE